MRRLLATAFVLGAVLVAGAGQAYAATDCSFTTVGTTMRLVASCTTDATILIPDGFSLDGNNRTIAGVDPPGDHFRGAVIATAGSVAHVRRLTVTVAGLADVCDAGDDRLRGIFFNGASGSIRDVRVIGLHQTLPTVCPEGSGIVVNKAPFDGTHPATAFVTVENVRVEDYSRLGVQGFGDVNLTVKRSTFVGTPIGQTSQEQHGVNVAGGAVGRIEGNRIVQSWDGNVGGIDTIGVRINEAVGSLVRSNVIDGSSIGVLVFAVCNFTGSASGNQIAENRIAAGEVGILLESFGNDSCPAQVNGNVLRRNQITSAAGFIATWGIFLGAFPGGLFAPQLDGNAIVGNRIQGVANGIVRFGDTNTSENGNVILP
jgi:hypothetical protein